MGVEERVRDFLDVWAKRKSGELPPPDLSVTCSVCNAVLTVDEYPELINGEIVLPGMPKQRLAPIWSKR